MIGASLTPSRFRARFRGMVLSALTGVFLGVVVGGVAATWAFPSIASAADCTSQDVNDVRTTGTHYGTGVNGTYGMYVYGYAPVCAHTSTILVRNDSNEYLELGWDNTAAGTPVTTLGCHDSGTGKDSVGRGTPVPIRVNLSLLNGWHCLYFPNVDLCPCGSFHTWAIKNTGGANHYTWRFMLDGDPNTLGGDLTFTPFDSAKSYTNEDAYGLSENESASFRGLQWLDGTVAHAWHDWAGADCYAHTRGGLPGGPYDSYIQTADTWIQVRTDGHYC